ncbi:uncharacterized protein LOC112540223 [Python bivittatus]|uniref:Uncharacterized protein LOC112540223 n=1 Tax=Python bivittatus TaxID=176946 RepID=A0A9F5IR64_PYTBI|nr:uncharacterized protein LOC112540223 [Python bivittatus]
MAHFIPCKGLPPAQATAQLFLDHVFRLRGMVTTLITDRGSQFSSKFWKALFGLLKVHSQMSSAHHPATNGEAERTHQMSQQYLRCYTSYSQDNWLELIPLAEFPYNNSVHSSIEMSLFQAGMGTPGFTTDCLRGGVPGATHFLREQQAAQQLLREQLAKAKQAYKRNADAHRQAGPLISVEDRVWLSTKFLASKRPSRKLSERFVGPYKVLQKVNNLAFRLQLPSSMKVHPVFHRSLLVKEALPSPLRTCTPPPPPVVIEGEEEYEVEAILDSHRRGKEIQYFIHWKGYPEADRSWENAKNVHAPELVIDFHRHFLSKPKPGVLSGTSAVNLQEEGGGGELEEGLVWNVGEEQTRGGSPQPSTSGWQMVGGRGANTINVVDVFQEPAEECIEEMASADGPSFSDMSSLPPLPTYTKVFDHHLATFKLASVDISCCSKLLLELWLGSFLVCAGVEEEGALPVAGWLEHLSVAAGALKVLGSAAPFRLSAAAAAAGGGGGGLVKSQPASPLPSVTC